MTLHFKNQALNFGIDMVAAGMPQDPKIKKAILDSVKGRLVAWDPIRQKEAWGVERPGPWNGGTLATAGNLVFEGTAAGHFEAYRADTGEKVWTFDAQTGVIAGPMTYSVNGEQYVAVLAGWGGVFPLVAGEVSFKSGHVRNISRVLAFKIGGKAKLPALPEGEVRALYPPPSTASAAEIRRGEAIFQRFCSGCHGDVAVSGGLVPDLRYSAYLKNHGWFAIVRDGVLHSRRNGGLRQRSVAGGRGGDSQLCYFPRKPDGKRAERCRQSQRIAQKIANRLLGKPFGACGKLETWVTLKPAVDMNGGSPCTAAILSEACYGQHI